jgi:hypothetical protein
VIETDEGNHRFVAQVTVYARAQKACDTLESSERAALKELLSMFDLEGVLIQAVGAAFCEAVSQPKDPLPSDWSSV